MSSSFGEIILRKRFQNDPEINFIYKITTLSESSNMDLIIDLFQIQD